MTVITFPLPVVPMKRIIFHWTAGAHKANATDRKAYHVLIEGDGKVVAGVAPISRNSGSLKDGYAAHTLNCNTDSIGVSLCAMAGAREVPFDPGQYPITPAQYEALIAVLSELAAFYFIPITPKTVLSHAEVQANLGITQRNKWDIARLPFGNNQTAKAIGDYVRRKVKDKMNGSSGDVPIAVAPLPEREAPEQLEPVPEGAQGVVATNGGNLTLRAQPSTSAASKGSIPNGTPLAVLEIGPVWLKVMTQAGYEGYVAREWVRLVDGPPVEEPTKPSRARALVSEVRALLDELEKEL